MVSAFINRLTFLGLILSLPCYSQDAEVMAYCENSLGKKFGKGLCHEFVDAVTEEFIGRKINYYGERFKRVMRPKAGDVIVFNHAKIKIGNRIYKVNHASIFKEKKGDVIYCYEQNVDGSPVIIGSFNIKDTQMKRVYFIRWRKIKNK